METRKISNTDLSKNILDEKQSSDLALLLEVCGQNIPNYHEDKIRKAFFWCVNSHRNQNRKNGETYYSHPFNVAMIIAKEIPLDETSVISALLHELTRHSGPYTLKDLRTEFGPTVAEIVEGIQKIHHVENHNIEDLENYRRLLLALFKDVRIILIKLADRLHNLRTLEYIDPVIQKKLAAETLEIYAPFAHRFGLGKIKGELEDLCFRCMNPEKYDEIKKTLQFSKEERQEYINKFIIPIKESLAKDPIIQINKVKSEIKGRAKHIYSIFNKTIERDKPIDELYDLYAIRIILDTDYNNFCFLVLGIISEIYAQVPDTFKNYISYPKKNGYQSIHVAFFGNDDRPVEVQIRTRKMNEQSERGVAAHFKYKPGFLPAETVMEDKNIEDWLDQVRTIFETVGDESPEKLIENLRRTLLFDEIFVFTPTNEFRVFPKDSTALDFAYGIHSDVGNHCIGAKVNGRIVPLDYKLQMGDLIEILTSKSQNPMRNWLEFVITHKAITAIQKYIKEESKNQSALGKQKWINEIYKIGQKISHQDFEKIIVAMNFKSADEFYLALYIGVIDIGNALDVYHSIRSTTSSGTGKKVEANIYDEQNKEETGLPKDKNEKSGGQSYQSYKGDLPIKLANCCYPIPGDQIIGEIIPGSEIVIHRRKCSKTLELISSAKPALVRLDWNIIKKSHYLSRIVIKGELHAELTSQITTVILTLNNIQIQGFKFDTNEIEFTGYVTINFKTIDDFNALMDKLQTIKGVKSVERVIDS